MDNETHLHVPLNVQKWSPIKHARHSQPLSGLGYILMLVEYLFNIFFFSWLLKKIEFVEHDSGLWLALGLGSIIKIVEINGFA